MPKVILYAGQFVIICGQDNFSTYFLKVQIISLVSCGSATYA